MVKTVLTIDGMACGMCESHVNDAVRSAAAVEILSEEPPDGERLRRALGGIGYAVTAIRSEPYERKRFTLFGKK